MWFILPAFIVRGARRWPANLHCACDCVCMSTSACILYVYVDCSLMSITSPGQGVVDFSVGWRLFCEIPPLIFFT